MYIMYEEDEFGSSSIILSLLVATVIVLYFYNRRRKLKLLPPGPAPLPLFGNLLDLLGDPLEVFGKLNQKYGDLVSLHVGSFTIVVVSGYDTLRELFVKRGDVTSDRPDLYGFKYIKNGEGIVSRSGPEWKIHRTFSIGALRDFGFGKKSLEGKIMEEVEIFLLDLEKQSEQSIHIKAILQTSVSNIICSIVFGKRFAYDDPVFVNLMKLINENISGSGLAGLLNLMPSLRLIPGDPLRSQKSKQNAIKVFDYIFDLIHMHQKEYDDENMNDFVDVYIKEIKKREGQNSTFTESQLMQTISDLFVAGSETTSTTLLWAILFFIHNPGVQEKCRQEIQRVVGDGRYPSLSDRQNMPYLEAVITEVFRCGDLMPIGLPHSASDELHFKDYVIPKGTMFLPIMKSVHSDPSLFPDPEKFDPTRFIDENGSFHASDHVIPFFFGRRVCMGEALARSEVFLFITSMVQRFEFKPENPNDLPTIKGHLGVTFQPRSYRCRIKKRT